MNLHHGRYMGYPPLTTWMIKTSKLFAFLNFVDKNTTHYPDDPNSQAFGFSFMFKKLLSNEEMNLYHGTIGVMNKCQNLKDPNFKVFFMLCQKITDKPTLWYMGYIQIPIWKILIPKLFAFYDYVKKITIQRRVEPTPWHQFISQLVTYF